MTGYSLLNGILGAAGLVFVLLANGDIGAPDLGVGNVLRRIRGSGHRSEEHDGAALRFFRFSITAMRNIIVARVSPCGSSEDGKPRRYPAGQMHKRWSPRGRSGAERSCSLFAEATGSPFRRQVGAGS